MLKPVTFSWGSFCGAIGRLLSYSQILSNSMRKRRMRRIHQGVQACPENLESRVLLSGSPATANDDVYTLEQDGFLFTDNSNHVLLNDTDPEGDFLWGELVSAPSHGQFSWGSDGNFAYIPDPGFAGTDSFTYQVNDGSSLSNVATVTLNVVSNQPIIQDDAYSVDQDDWLSVSAPGVLGNDSDPQGRQMSAILFSGAQNGSVGLNSDGSFDYFPTAGFYGTDSFTYYVDFNDGTFSAPATVTLTVDRTVPIANNDSYTTDQDTFLSVPASGVLANDLGLDGQPLNAFLVSGPQNGQVGLNLDGSFTYLPDSGFAGTDTFTYFAESLGQFSELATVTLNVLNVNDPPTVADDSYTVNEDTVLTIDAAAGVLNNDFDLDGDSMTVQLVDNPFGSVSLNADGSFVYTPAQDYFGVDTFTYVATDGSLTSQLATVSITVNNINDAPTVYSQSVTTDEDVDYAGFVSGIDVDEEPFSYELSSGPANGTLTFNSNGTFTYTPNADFNGTDSFTFVGNDGTTTSAPGTVDITINPVNDAPTANDQSITTNEDVAYSGSVTGGDIDGDSLSYAVVTGPANGTLTFNADGTFTYTPNADFNGTDSFAFVANDGTVDSLPGTVSITVAPVNDAPTTSDATYSLAENSSAGTSVGFVSGTDIDGDALTYQIVTGNEAGAFTIDAATGEITVIDSAPLDYETITQFALTVSVTDGEFTTSALVTINLTDVNETIAVSIDIVPGDSSNSISAKGNNKVDVAILSTATFDAQTIDITTLRFGQTGAEDSLVWKRGAPVYSIEDVNGDGLLDLVVQFDRDLMGFQSGDTVGYLTGQTLDGSDLAGSDSVNLTGNWN